MGAPQRRTHLVLRSLGIKLHRPRLLHAWCDDDHPYVFWLFFSTSNYKQRICKGKLKQVDY